MGRSAVATVAWLATDHQQLMYLLSPEGKPVFYIPGVEVVHKVSTPINLPEESNKIKMELERCSLLQGEAGNEQLVSLLTSTPPRPRGTSRCRACSPPPKCRMESRLRTSLMIT